MLIYIAIVAVACLPALKNVLLLVLSSSHVVEAVAAYQLNPTSEIIMTVLLLLDSVGGQVCL